MKTRNRVGFRVEAFFEIVMLEFLIFKKSIWLESK